MRRPKRKSAGEKKMDTRAASKSDTMRNVLENMLNELDACVYVSDMETDKILFINKKIKETFNIDNDSIGIECWKIIQKGFSERCPFCPIFRLAKDNNTPVDWEDYNSVTGRYYKKTDSIIDWIDGKKVHLQYAVDITDIKLVQREAAGMLSILKNILNGMDAYVYVSDMETDEILFINNRMRQGFGLDEQAVGKICWQVFQDGFTERCSFCPNYTLQKNPSASVVWEEHNTVTGRHYKNVDSVIEWMDGKKVHMQHSTDVTDILEAQKETQTVKERLEIALTSSQAGVWEIAFDTRQMTYDAMCARLFGFDPEKSVISIDALVSHLERTVQSATGPDVIKGLLRRDPYAGILARDFHLFLPDGAERHIRNYGNTIRNKDGKALRVIGMCIDISPHVRMENDLLAAKEAAEKASYAKSRFLSNMSHEIRTPMNAIMGMTDILLHEDLSERQREYMNDIKVSSSALLGIINDILDFSKIEAGKLQIVSVDYDILQLLRNIGSMFEFTAKSKGITFSLDIRGAMPPCVYGDDIRLRQVLVNIIGNAVKFTQKGGVSFIAKAAGGKLCFDIIDTGVGIKTEEIPNIFKDFDRVDLNKNRAIAGTGLGLSITKSLVAMMDGTIQVKSIYGRGTAFHLEFPLVVGDASKMALDAAEDDFVNAPEASVLVVDDMEVNLHVASGLLRLYGIVCDTALSGKEAIQKIDSKYYDIVFMDHMMPDMDGLETTIKLREKYSMDSLVIVALTANAIEGVKDILMNAQMNDYMSKPIDKFRLNHILRQWLPAHKVRYAKEKEQTSDDEQGLSSLLQNAASIDGVDVRLGLVRTGGMQDVYEASLAILTRRLPGVMDNLASFLRDEDAKRFSIEVHGLKGSLGNIGAAGMALFAEALEHKAKENDLRFCRDKLPALTAALRELHAKLAALFADDAPLAVTEAGDKDLLLRQLRVVRDLLDSFEGDEARAIVLELRGYDYGAGANEALKDLCGLIEEFEYERAMAVIDSM